MTIRYFSKKTSCKLKLIVLSVMFLIILSSPQTLLSQVSQEERVAVISKFKGQVKVSHDAIWKDVKKIGNRIRNSSVYDEDEVVTMAVSTAEMVFNDNTHLEVKENTTLKITTKQLSEEERGKKGLIRAVADTQRNVVRRINLNAGKLWANITPSRAVLTEFETPTGVASVRGTIVSLVYNGINTLIEVFKGLMEFKSSDGSLSFEIRGGVTAKISAMGEGAFKIDVISGVLSIPTSTGVVTIGKGSSLGVKEDKGAGGSVVDSVKGDVTITDENGNTMDLEIGTKLDILPGSTFGSEGTQDFVESFQQETVDDFGLMVQGPYTTQGGPDESPDPWNPPNDPNDPTNPDEQTRPNSLAPRGGYPCHLDHDFGVVCDPLDDILNPILE